MTAQPAPLPDFQAIKVKQQATWASGDYAVIGTGILLIAELLCESMDIRSGWSLLDVAAGSGNASLAAARRGCRVTSTDYVPALLGRGKERAAAEGLHIEFREADAEALPFADAQFDAAISTVGIMFAPDQLRAAAEIFRVVRPGGVIGLASWTPSGMVGQMLRVIGKHLAPPPGLTPTTAWGTELRLQELFPRATKIEIMGRTFTFRSTSPEAWFENFKTYYGPMNRAFAALDEPGRQALTSDILALMNSLNRSGDTTMVVPSEYLEAVIYT